MILPVLLHPKSIGEITLQSADPRAPPIIDPHYLEHQHDVKVLVEVILLILKLFTTQSIKIHNTVEENKRYCKRLSWYLPFCESFSL